MDARYRVRPMRQRDLDAIIEVENASFGSDAYDRKLFADYSRVCEGLFLVAESAGRVRGYSVTRVTGSRAELISIAVDPPARGQGAASALLRSTLRRLRRGKVERLTLMVKLDNTAARQFYDKFGFTKVRVVRGYYEDGADGCVMRKSLPYPVK